MSFAVLFREGMYHLTYLFNGAYNDIHFYSREEALAEAFKIQQSLRN